MADKESPARAVSGRRDQRLHKNSLTYGRVYGSGRRRGRGEGKDYLFKSFLNRDTLGQEGFFFGNYLFVHKSLLAFLRHQIITLDKHLHTVCNTEQYSFTLYYWLGLNMTVFP